jgi:hypothetical protein
MNASPTEPTEASRLRRSTSLLKLDNFEAWRLGVTRWLIFTSALLVAYWILWLADRGIVASDHTAEYIAFEQSFPLADAWLLAALLAAAVQLWRRRPSALAWVFVVGGAGVYLAALDVLYDLQHGVYAKPQGGAVELAINLVTTVSSIGIMAFGWRFRYTLLGTSTDRRPR